MRRRIQRKHFTLAQEEAIRRRESITEEARLVSRRQKGPEHIAVIGSEMPYWIRAGISKVFGASPAIVFEPMPNQGSTTRKWRKPRSYKQKLFWAAVNGGADNVPGGRNDEF